MLIKIYVTSHCVRNKTSTPFYQEGDNTDQEEGGGAHGERGDQAEDPNPGAQLWYHRGGVLARQPPPARALSRPLAEHKLLYFSRQSMTCYVVGRVLSLVGSSSCSAAWTRKGVLPRHWRLMHQLSITTKSHISNQEVSSRVGGIRRIRVFLSLWIRIR